MPKLRYIALPTAVAEAYRGGAPDANGQAPERHISDGDGVPCRHCLTDVAKGEPYLILAYRPFPALQPYAETGPIFLHAERCQRHPVSNMAPDFFLKRKHMLLKGYGTTDRIVYGTGTIVPAPELDAGAAAILTRDDVAYVHVRSALNNCYWCRIEHGENQPGLD